MPKPKNPRHVISNRTYGLSAQTIELIGILSEKFSEEGGIRISRNQVIEMAIFAIRNRTLRQLVGIDK